MTARRNSMEKTVVKRLLFFIRAVSMLTNRPMRPPTPRGINGARNTVRISTGQKAAGREPMTIWQQTPAVRSMPAWMRNSSK